MRDSKAERIASEEIALISLIQKPSPLLAKMVDSFGRSFDDQANALVLVHLYEIRDAVAKHYGSESAAISALGVRKEEWKRLGRLANDEPLLEGRHRGRGELPLRHASETELREAREIARRIIQAFAT